MALTAPPTPPSRGDPVNFSTRGDLFFAWFPAFVIEMNAALAAILASQSATEAAAASAASAASMASMTANSKGAWSGLTGPLNVPASVFHNGLAWGLLQNLANVTTQTPAQGSAYWTPLSFPSVFDDVSFWMSI